MGIKDKVLDILFDDEGEQVNHSSDDLKSREKKTYNASSFLDTGSVFIDATSPLPKANPTAKPQQQETTNQDSKTVGQNGYQMSENISPIFGIIDSKNKKSKNISKIKSANEISNKNFDSQTKTQKPAYTSVVISPIYGPIANKPAKKSSKPRKKITDPFDRDINDTGSFDAVINEEEQEVAPEFENVKEDISEVTETIGDTDRLVKISDRINRIKNEAANIYNEDDSNEEIVEDDYHVETIEHENISDLIHSVQKYDGKIEHKNVSTTSTEPTIVPENDDTINEQVINDEPSINVNLDNFNQNLADNNQETNTFEDEPSDDFVDYNSSNSDDSNSDISEKSHAYVDDIFQDEENVEEEKDLFSALFGDD